MTSPAEAPEPVAKWISPAEVSRRTGLTRHAVMALVRTGKIRSIEWPSPKGRATVQIPETEVARILTDLSKAAAGGTT